MTNAFVERRTFGRRATHEHAIVRIPGRPALRCVIRNISDGGALLDFGDEVWLPYSFQLHWESSRRQEACEVRHSNGGRIGVLFVTHKAAVEGRETLTVNDVAPCIAENTNPKR